MSLFLVVVSLSLSIAASKSKRPVEDTIPALEPILRARDRVPFGVGEHPLPASEAAIDVEDRESHQSPLIVIPKIAGGIVIAPRLGGSLTIAFEGGYRFAPVERLIGLSLEPQLALTWSTAPFPAGHAKSFEYRFRLPLYASANVELRHGLLRMAVGPSFHWFSVRAERQAQTTRDSGAAFGVAAQLAYYFPAGAGRVGVELRYQLSPALFRGQSELAHSLEAALGYAF